MLDESKKLTGRIIQDYEAGAFEKFDPAKAHTGWPMESIEDTIAYHTIHEGIHIGVMLTLRRLARS